LASEDEANWQERTRHRAIRAVLAELYTYNPNESRLVR